MEFKNKNHYGLLRAFHINNDTVGVDLLLGCIKLGVASFIETFIVYYICHVIVYGDYSFKNKYYETKTER